MDRVATESKPEINRASVFSLQACVPKTFTDEEATRFVNETHPAGTSQGWVMRHNGDPALNGSPERVQCAGRPDCVHIMFDC